MTDTWHRFRTYTAHVTLHNHDASQFEKALWKAIGHELSAGDLLTENLTEVYWDAEQPFDPNPSITLTLVFPKREIHVILRGEDAIKFAKTLNMWNGTYATVHTALIYNGYLLELLFNDYVPEVTGPVPHPKGKAILLTFVIEGSEWKTKEEYSEETAKAKLGKRPSWNWLKEES